MAPKRTAKVVKTTKKVLEETVEILSVPAGESQNTVVDVPPSDSKVVEVDVQTEAAQVPVADKPTQEEEEPEAQAAEDGSGGDGEQDKRDEPRTPKKVEKLPRTDQEPPAEEGCDCEGDVEREKEGKPLTPKKVEQPPKGEAAEKGRDRERQPEGKRRRRRRMKRYSGPGGGVGEMDGVGRGYKRYVFQVLKQVHPELEISSRAMAVVDGMLGDMFERLADEAGRLSAYVGKTTLSSREIQAAVQLVLPGELGKHAITEGTSAVTNYIAAAAAAAAHDGK